MDTELFTTDVGSGGKDKGLDFIYYNSILVKLAAQTGSKEIFELIEKLSEAIPRGNTDTDGADTN